MLVRAPYTFLFILTICCWFRHNAAVPLAHSNQMQDAFKEKKTDSEIDSDATSNSRPVKETETSDEEDENNKNDDENNEDDENQNMINNVNQNVNMNMNFFDDIKRQRKPHKRHKQSTTENTVTAVGQGTEEIAKEELSTDCVSSNKKNQRYSSSFFTNTTNHPLNVEKEFHDLVGNNSKLKKSSSVHEGEDITLCWIETTTIKEDKTIRPPKRLVIREYTISFENSATIPERYLECKRYEGELTKNDPDIGKTALFEIIDEDTMVSRIVNFTSVNHVGNVITWEHKKVKCGVGPVVSKNIVELNDGSKNPKKRVEIKVSPKMHQLTATTEEECTESSTITESITQLTTGPLCENSVCEATMISPGISSETDKFSTTEETITKLQSESESESEEEFIRSSTTTKSDEELSRRRSTSFSKRPTIQEQLDCEENPSDPACLTPVVSSSKELFTKILTTTEVVPRDKTSSISDKEVSSEEEIFRPSVEERSEETTQSLSTLIKEKEITSELVTEETTPSATEISVESSEEYVPRSTEQDLVDTSSLETKTRGVDEYSKLKESSTFTIPTSEELGKVDHISSSESISSSEIEIVPEVTTTESSIEIIEFTKESSKPDQTFDKVSETPISTESEAIIIESSSMSEEVTSEETKESVSSIEETTIGGPKASEEIEFISTITTPPAKIRSTTSSPITSGEVSYSCEISEDCASSEGCDESGNCGKMTTTCDSETCSEEEISESQTFVPTFHTTRSPRLTKVPLTEESVTIEHTTMLTSQESDKSTDKHITDTRRSTTTSTLRHKLNLKVKILLEHENEFKEKHNLVEVEKHLSLDENPERHFSPDLPEQLKSLNYSVNMEAINALLNCTSLGNLTRDSNILSEEQNDGSNDTEFTNTEDSKDSEQLTSGSVDKSDYQEHKVLSRKRRSLDNETETPNKFIQQNLYDPTDAFNISQTQHAELTNTTYSSQFSTTTNHSEEETTTNNYTERGKNVTEEGEQSTMPSTKVVFSDVDLSNTSESYDANVTNENTQLTTVSSVVLKLEDEISNVTYIESEKNVTNERNESTVPSITDSINNETKLEIVREILPGLQEDVTAGLRHITELTQSNLTSINNAKEIVKTNLLDILADPNDGRIRSRRRRAVMEEVGHWSNERIKEAPMGGNLRSLIEFTLYKVLS